MVSQGNTSGAFGGGDGFAEAGKALSGFAADFELTQKRRD
jgi:hypothetical protein